MRPKPRRLTPRSSSFASPHGGSRYNLSMVISISTAPETGAPTIRHQSIEAIAGKGLEGDRYATGKGFYTGVIEWDAHLTLMEEEPFTSLATSHGVEIDPNILRRNIVTRGTDLRSLIGREFQVGERAVFRGRKAWPPCSHIVKLSGRKEIFQYLAEQTGIGADVLVGGPIKVGDEIRLFAAERSAHQVRSGPGSLP